MVSEKKYIGDGVYAKYDGMEIILTTQRARGEDRIHLMPSMLKDLAKMVEDADAQAYEDEDFAKRERRKEQD